MCDDEPAMDRQTERNGVWRKYISTFFTDRFVIAMLVITRHRASTSMYSLTFCVRVMLPERHLQWKPAVQAAAVMVRTPPVDGQSPASQPRPLPIYGAQF